MNFSKSFFFAYSLVSAISWGANPEGFYTQNEKILIYNSNTEIDEEEIATNRLEVFQKSDNEIFFELEAFFANGHICTAKGKAQKDNNKYVFKNLDDDCELSLEFKDKEILLTTDKENSCRGYCGARGYLDGLSFPTSGNKILKDSFLKTTISASLQKKEFEKTVQILSTLHARLLPNFEDLKLMTINAIHEEALSLAKKQKKTKALELFDSAYFLSNKMPLKKPDQETDLEDDDVDYLAFSKKTIPFLNDYAYFLIQKKDYSMARIILKKVIKIDPQRSVAFLNLAEAYEKSDELLSAQYYFYIYASQTPRAKWAKKLTKRCPPCDYADKKLPASFMPWQGKWKVTQEYCLSQQPKFPNAQPRSFQLELESPSSFKVPAVIYQSKEKSKEIFCEITETRKILNYDSQTLIFVNNLEKAEIKDHGHKECQFTRNSPSLRVYKITENSKDRLKIESDPLSSSELCDGGNYFLELVKIQ